MSQKKLIEAAAAATGDEILHAAVFEPRGLAGKRMLGAAMGGAVGGAAGDAAWATAIGTAVGAEALTMTGGEQGFFVFVLALGREQLHLLAPAKGGVDFTQSLEVHRGDLVQLHAFDLDALEVTVHAKVSVRTLTLEDASSGDKIELEGRRVPWTHTKELIGALTHGDSADAEPAPTAG